ncbi:Rieske 2Fe-2S domain-containing protein [Azospira sp. I13]|uniref:Rieske (2Fe-2S) protein n=1 Tax=Azospira sp. I13 TaxID=1765050 RepID=UPI000D597614|nr:Rieske 2Fe-2S domain-containing protein [Azospira sp. I13]
MAASARLICASADLEEGGRGVRFTVTRRGREESAFAVRFSGQVRAYLNRCAHVPIELDWQHGEFFDHSKLYLVCATHGALYAPESGQCLGGRCHGKGLTPLDVEERDGAVYYLDSD